MSTKNYTLAIELAKKIQYNSDYLTQLCRSKELDCVCISKLWFVSLRSIREFLEKNKKDLNFSNNLSIFKIKENLSGQKLIKYNAKEYVDTDTASKLFSYSKDYITQLARKGEVSSLKISKIRLISKKDLASYIAKRQSESKAQESSKSRYNYTADPGFEAIPILKKRQGNAYDAQDAKSSKNGSRIMIHNDLPKLTHDTKHLLQARSNEDKKLKIGADLSTTPQRKAASANPKKQTTRPNNAEYKKDSNFYTSRFHVIDLHAIQGLNNSLRKSHLAETQKETENDFMIKLLLFFISISNTFLFIYFVSLIFSIIEQPYRIVVLG